MGHDGGEAARKAEVGKEDAREEGSGMRGGGGKTLPPGEARALLDQVRERILEVDDLLIRTIGERRDLVLAVARAKEALDLPVLDPAREAAVVRRAAARARELGVDEEMTRDVIWRIIASARAAQEGRPPGWPDAPLPPPRGEGPDGAEEPPEGGSRPG